MAAVLGVVVLLLGVGLVGSFVVHRMDRVSLADQAGPWGDGRGPMRGGDTPNGNNGRGNANGRKRLRLEFTDGAPDLQTGDRIRARGRMKNADTLQLSRTSSGTQVVAPIVSNSRSTAMRRPRAPSRRSSPTHSGCRRPS